MRCPNVAGAKDGNLERNIIDNFHHQLLTEHSILQFESVCVMIKPPPLTGGQEKRISLSELLLDADNPRFGAVSPEKDQSIILDFIVERFGVDDVLSSLAVNGYFDAEPLVCRKVKNSKFSVVAEGNRRLAACLILAGDDRAERQKRRASQFIQIWKEHGFRSIDPIPVILFEDDQSQQLLSYLGVRHIAASQPWDSYAKAAWVARVVEQEQLKIVDVALMIGDQHKTISRLLEGYYFMKQTVDAGRFRPSDSVRRGRGSVSEYPFSWVYTILGYTSVRNFLGINDEDVKPNPLDEKSFDKAALLTKSLFGDRSAGLNSAISDSRQLGDLASVFASAEKVSLLESGKSVIEIERITKPIDDRLRYGLGQVRSIQTDMLAGIAESEILTSVAESLLPMATMNRRTGSELEKKLRTLTLETEQDDI